MSQRIISTRVICKEPGRYAAWPTIAKTPAGELLVVFSGDRDEHVCPYGKSQLIRSRDGGVNWTAAAGSFFPRWMRCFPIRPGRTCRS